MPTFFTEKVIVFVRLTYLLEEIWKTNMYFQATLHLVMLTKFFPNMKTKRWNSTKSSEFQSTESTEFVLLIF